MPQMPRTTHWQKQHRRRRVRSCRLSASLLSTRGRIISAILHSQVCTPPHLFAYYGIAYCSDAEATIPTHVFSLSEAAAREAHETHREALLNHNRRYLMRVYPSGLRVTSSNLDPSFFWQQGAQMVALNWQSCDKGMMLNDAMFADGPGWVLKPEGYRSSSDCSSDAKPVVQTVDLSIEVFAGQQLPLPLGEEKKGFHPYVKCKLHLARVEEESTADGNNTKNEDAVSKNAKTKLRTKTCSGIDPDFGGEKLSFSPATNIVQELSFVRYVGSFMETFFFCLPFLSLCRVICREGIPSRSVSGELARSSTLSADGRSPKVEAIAQIIHRSGALQPGTELLSW